MTPFCGERGVVVLPTLVLDVESVKQAAPLATVLKLEEPGTSAPAVLSRFAERTEIIDLHMAPV